MLTLALAKKKRFTRIISVNDLHGKNFAQNVIIAKKLMDVKWGHNVLLFSAQFGKVIFFIFQTPSRLITILGFKKPSLLKCIYYSTLVPFIATKRILQNFLAQKSKDYFMTSQEFQ